MKYLLLPLFLLFTTPVFAGGLRAFENTDVPYEHIYFNEIAYLKANNVVQGYEDGTFKPNNSINRAEFVKILMPVSSAYRNDLEGCSDDSTLYNDVQDTSLWYYDAVKKATCDGIISGYKDGNFRPDWDINYAEASKIIARAFDLESDESGDNWYDGYVKTMEKNGLKPRDNIRPEDVITRGEMAYMMAHSVRFGFNSHPLQFQKPYKSTITYDGDNHIKASINNKQIEIYTKETDLPYTTFVPEDTRFIKESGTNWVYKNNTFYGIPNELHCEEPPCSYNFNTITIPSEDEYDIVLKMLDVQQ